LKNPPADILAYNLFWAFIVKEKSMRVATWFIIFLGIFLIIFLSQSLFRSKNKIITMNKIRFFMPVDWFIYLIILINYWAMLLMMLSSMLDEKNHMISLIALSLFAPFLNWWHKKRTGEL